MKKIIAIIHLLVFSVALLADTVTLTGNGTEASPYLIGNYDELVAFATLSKTDDNNGIWGKLTSDITANTSVLNEETGELNGTPTNQWIGIGNSGHNYTGTFDGQGHTISGLCCNYDNPNQGNAGFVLYLAPTGVVKNLIIKDSFFKANAGNNGIEIHAGAICGASHGTITNCASFATVINGYWNGSYWSGNGAAGGICGFGQDCEISRCYSCPKLLVGKITNNQTQCGTILGYSTGTAINYCFSSFPQNDEERNYCKGLVGSSSNVTYEANPKISDVVESSAFASGEVTYKMNITKDGVANERPWTQTLDSTTPDALPTLDQNHKTVYGLRNLGQVNVEKGKYLTIWDPEGFTMTGGLKAYKVKGLAADKESIVMEEVSETMMIPLILYARESPGSYTLTGDKQYFNGVPEDDANNCLRATYSGRTVTSDANNISYMLQSQSFKKADKDTVVTAFYPLANEQSYTFKENQSLHSFLQLPASSVGSSKVLGIVFEDTPSAIADVVKDGLTDDSVTYNICGQRVAPNSGRGIYIIKGRKYLAR